MNDFINLKNKTIEYESKIKIIFLQNDKNYGLTYSLNKAIKHSSGSLIMRQDSDDISINTRMQTLVDYLINNPQKDLVYSNVIIINDKNEIIKNKKIIF